MDITQCHTVNIARAAQSQVVGSNEQCAFLPAHGEKVRFGANDGSMDITQCHTVNIARAAQSQVVGSNEQCASLPSRGEKTVQFDADDGSMDITQCHTVNIARVAQSQVVGSNEQCTFLPAHGEKTVRFDADDGSMDITQCHTVNIARHAQSQVVGSNEQCASLPSRGEKTVQFDADDGSMDITQCHTVNIARVAQSQVVGSNEQCTVLPAHGEKTVRFDADDGSMDITQCHTVNIARHAQSQVVGSNEQCTFLPAHGEKTVRFDADDGSMDITKCHTVNIARHAQSQAVGSNEQCASLPSRGEKTIQFDADDGSMDITQCHTVNIARHAQSQVVGSHEKCASLPAHGEKTIQFDAGDGSMDITQCHTVNIDGHVRLQVVRSSQNFAFIPNHGEKTMKFDDNDGATDITQCHSADIDRCAQSQVVTSDPTCDSIPTCREKAVVFDVNAEAVDITQCHSADPAAHAEMLVADSVSTEAEDMVTACRDVGRQSGFIDEPRSQNGEEVLGFVSAVMEKSLNKPLVHREKFNGGASSRKQSINLDVTEVQTDHILEQPCRDEPLSSVKDLSPHCDHLKGTEVESHKGSSNCSVVTAADGLDSVCPQEFQNVHNSIRANQTIIAQNLENSPGAGAVVPDPPNVPSQKRESTRISLADLRSKVRRLSHIINEVPESVAVDNCTVPLSQMDEHLDSDSIKVQPSVESDLDLGEGDTGDKKLKQSAATTSVPFNLKTQQLMSKLSMGSFMPKLPQRSKSIPPNEGDSRHTTSTEEHTRTNTIVFDKPLKNTSDEQINICDEVLGSDEDLSETLDTRSPQNMLETGLRPPEGLNEDETLMDDVFEENALSATRGRKRLSDDEANVEAEKRMRPSADGSTNSTVETRPQFPVVECDSNITTAANVTTQTTDSYSSGRTASSGYETTFESTCKPSLFESQLEDYASDEPKKLNDGTITVLEFFKLFNLDFVIHNPRQSVISGKFGLQVDCTPMDLLRDKHISRPKQMVYETDVLNLTEKVDGLKIRRRDLQKPLKTVNRPLWEEMKNFSEKELRCFGATLKERNKFFRTASKVQSHEMKEVLYSALVQANQDEQQKLSSTIEKADKMLKTLDSCISELETELAAVEESGFGDQPSLKFCQQELKKVTEALADNDRKLNEVGLQNKQASDKAERIKSETEKLENHISMLQTINEWKLGEKTDSCTVYTFLYNTLHLQLDYEKSDGKDADESQRKMSHITFTFLLDEDKSACHARLVQNLLSLYFGRETAWVNKYPDHSYVPKLLHDVSLVVSRCRLLGEEIRLLKMWGGLRLDILVISCVDTQVHIVFSSLKKMSKFEVVFAVSLTEHVSVQVQSFKNIIGNTASQQIEEIVASFLPTKKLLTKVVKKIHKNLLC
ncbi:kinetochore scaffold 1 [Thalassophryne amazonica]|uniref:kinetochore scaffold 1 n=1 Tax=Thalassophryne amazonica TaxID=390379 RepID=UPI0014722FE3|nr:kinetochore scaffold 1 [Thalassophryne amazonica]